MHQNSRIVTDLDHFKDSHPTFVTEIDMDDFEFDRATMLEAGCNFNTSEQCGLKKCRQRHRRGFILKTKDGHYFNIGQYCGKTNLGVTLHEWLEGYEAALKILTQKEVLSVEPKRLLKILHENKPRLLQLERINTFIWQHLKPLALEAAKRKKERRYRGLEFIASRLQFSSQVEQTEQEIEIILACGQEQMEREMDRTRLLAAYRLIKARITRMRSFESACLRFFGSEPGFGEAERGENLVRIFDDFSCIGDREMPACDVTSFTESIYIPALRKRVSAYGVFPV